MNEESIRELCERLFNLTYKSNYGSGYELPVISKDQQQKIENVIRQWALEFHDSKVGTLEAKAFVYEQIISNSNFAPMIHSGSNTRGGNHFEDKTESGLLED